MKKNPKAQPLEAPLLSAAEGPKPGGKGARGGPALGVRVRPSFCQVLSFGFMVFGFLSFGLRV